MRNRRNLVPRSARLEGGGLRAIAPLISVGVGFASLWRLLGSNRDATAAPIAGPLVREPRLARLEAVLFLAREPLTTRRVAKLAVLADGTEARALIRRLNQQYDRGGSAFRVEQLAGGFQILTRPIFGPWLRRLLQTPIETRLSAPAMETLAVVAYRQPVVRAEIEAVRGVQCGDILRQLMDRDLIRIVSRSDDLGRPLLYGPTKRFLQVFGLRNLDELPLADQLRRLGAPPVARSMDAKNGAAGSAIPPNAGALPPTLVSESPAGMA